MLPIVECSLHLKSYLAVATNYFTVYSGNITSAVAVAASLSRTE